MKKWIACVWIVALCLGLLLYSIFDRTAEIPQPTPQQTADPSEQSGPESEEPQQPEPIRVYLYDEDENALAAWEEIIRDYSVDGVEILLWDGSQEHTPALTVQSELPQPEACADLSGTTAYAQLTNWDLAVNHEGKVCAIPTEIAGFGLLCNPRLLASVSSISEVNGLQRLRETVAGIESTGVAAFAAVEQSQLAQWLAMLPEDSRDFAQLYLSHMAEVVDGEESGAPQLHMEKAVFCLGSTEDCVHAEEGDATILPVYLGRENEQNQTLCVVASRYLSVSSSLSKEQLDAALAFLDYLVLPGEDGTVPLDKLQQLSPFRQATYAGNALEQVLRGDLTAGKECLVCQSAAPADQELIEAMLAFAQDPSEENWLAFRAAVK